MSADQYWRRCISGEAGWAGRACLALLRPLSWLYAFAAAAYRRWYDAGLGRRTAPVVPVISIGSLSLGGAGKTTATAFLAQKFAEAGVKVGIVLRGYGGAASGPVTVSLSEAGQASVEEVGDEAILLAEVCPEAVVVVGRKREAAVERAAAMGARLVLLDDGFQYFRMRRELDIVLVNALQFGPQLSVFPAGLLREPPGTLRKADQIWITYASAVSSEVLSALKAWCRRWTGGRDVVLTNHRIRRCLQIPDGGEIELAGRKIAAFCGIGSPEGFRASLEQAGASSIVLREFLDHHRYTAAELNEIAKWATEAGVDVVVTTAKDAVRLPAHRWPESAPPLAVAHVDLEVIEGAAHVEEVISSWAQALSTKAVLPG